MSRFPTTDAERRATRTGDAPLPFPATVGSMKRLVGVVTLLLVLLALVVGAPVARADDKTPSSWRVQRYEPTVTLDETGTATVVLDLWFDFGRDAGRGPYIWLPLRQEVRDNPDVWRMLDTKLVSVESTTGASTEVLLEESDGNLVVRIGSANRKDRLGVQHYRITYTSRGLVAPGAASGLDEFNWNAVGLGWTVPMDAVRVTMSGPGAVERVACFAGAGFDRPCQAEPAASGATFTAGRLSRGEGVQVVAGFPAGTFVGAEPRFEKRYHIGNMYPVTPLSGGITAAVAGLGAVALMRARRGRDEAYVGVAPGTTPLAGQEARVGVAMPTTVAVQFTPPKGTTPGEVGTLVDGAADTIDVSATLVDLAVRKHVRISELGDKKWQFERLAGGDALTNPERHLLDALFKNGSPVRSDEIKADVYVPMFPGTKSELDKRVTKELGWFNGTPTASRAGAVTLGVLLIAAGVGGGFVLGFAWGLGIVGLAPVGLGLAMLAMQRQFVRRTADGTAVLAQARGFELYLKTAEADQIRFEESIDVFSRYLPYAMVFGVAERWAKIFQQLAAEGRYQPDTSWYVGPTGYFYGPAFAHSMGSLGSSLGASMAMSAAPSGGSGGGSGFSGGGGFGGGGGGGW